VARLQRACAGGGRAAWASAALEKAKFLAITASNLDEFYMVRVGGLQLMRDQGLRGKDNAGLTVTQQLDQIKARTVAFIARQYEILNEQVLPELRSHGIRRLSAAELTPLQRTLLQDHFLERVHPVLSPIEIDPKMPPSLPALNLVMLCLVASEGNEDRQVMFVLPSNLPATSRCQMQRRVHTPT